MSKKKKKDEIEKERKWHIGCAGSAGAYSPRCVLYMRWNKMRPLPVLTSFYFSSYLFKELSRRGATPSHYSPAAGIQTPAAVCLDRVTALK